MTDSLTPYKQIYPVQCSKLAKMGYRSLINIRPDDEVDNQPRSDAIANAAKQAQIEYAHIPFDCERLTLPLVEDFAAHYHAMPKPILLFCGTGNRAKLLYQSAVMQGLI